MMTTTRFAVLSLLVATAGRAWAAEGDAPTVPMDRTTLLSVSSTVEYTSNAAGSDRRSAMFRGLALEDQIVSPETAFTLARPLGATMAFLEGDLSYDFHRVNTIRNTDRFLISGGAGSRFGLCHESVVGQLTRYQNDVAQLILGATTNTQDSELVNGTATCGRETGFAPTISVTQRWVSNSQLLYRQIDSNSLTVESDLAYRQPALGSISAFGLFEQIAYPNRRTPVSLSREDGYDLYVGGVRYDRSVGSRLTLTLSVSYTTLVQNLQTSPGFSGFTYSGDVGYEVNASTSGHFTATRATVPSTRPDANFSVNETYGAYVTRAVGPRLSLRLSADRKTFDFKKIPGLALVGDLTHQTTYIFNASANYTLNKRVTLILDVGDLENQADYPGLTYSATTVMFTARASF